MSASIQFRPGKWVGYQRSRRLNQGGKPCIIARIERPSHPRANTLRHHAATARSGGLADSMLAPPARPDRWNLQPCACALRRGAVRSVSARSHLYTAHEHVAVNLKPGARRIPPWCLIVDSAQGRRRIPLSCPGTVLVGSDSACEISIDQPTLSRQHRALHLPDARLEIEDLGSRNGSFVDNRRLEPGVAEPVQAATSIRLGDVEVRIARIDDDDATPLTSTSARPRRSPIRNRRRRSGRRSGWSSPDRRQGYRRREGSSDNRSRRQP